MKQPQSAQSTESPAIFQRSFKRAMWRKTAILAIEIYIVLFVFTYLLYQPFALTTISRPLAATAMLLFGASFALSGFCYYWDFLDTKIGYRKYFGLMGYWVAIAYSISLLIVEPDRYFFGFFDNLFSADFIFGLSGMAIFTFVALISNNRAMQRMGSQNWRKALRLGYIAWLMLAIRVYVIEKDLWFEWFSNPHGLPPPRMLMALFVTSVILFRLSVEVSKMRQKKRSLR